MWSKALKWTMHTNQLSSICVLCSFWKVNSLYIVANDYENRYVKWKKFKYKNEQKKMSYTNLPLREPPLAFQYICMLLISFKNAHTLHFILEILNKYFVALNDLSLPCSKSGWLIYWVNLTTVLPQLTNGLSLERRQLFPLIYKNTNLIPGPWLCFFFSAKIN